MASTVYNQAYVFLCAVAGGILIAFLYDLFRIRRKALKTNIVFIYIEDFVYWILVALVMFGIVYFSNEGELRGYIFLGTLTGVILYILTLSKIVIGSAIMIIKVIYRIVSTIWKVVTYPFRLVYKILRVPARGVKKHTRRFFQGAKHVTKSKLGRAFDIKRAFRNIRKKK
ncbi:MAG: spore cortex biosynthesis protein YabQ [Clostridia bacterium]|nr:spore cortex biosynthesis protein YabQ [Clostridia bacterium]